MCEVYVYYLTLLRKKLFLAYESVAIALLFVFPM